MKNVVGLFDNIGDAEAVVRELHGAGVAQADISFAGRNPDQAVMESNEYIGSGHSEAAEGAGFGATGGTVVGGLTGLLVGLGALAIPGVGPVIAGGSLAAALGSAALGAGIGAATGGLLGALVGAGIPEEDAHVYSEGIRRGGALVMAKVDDGSVETALDIMERHNVVDIDERGTDYRSGGWTRFEADDDNYRSTTSATMGDTGTTSATMSGTGTTTGDNDYERSSKVGTAGGAVAGAATGATLGSAGGPVGTVIGGVAGAVVGGGVGAAGDAAGVEATDNDSTMAGGDYNRTGADYGARDKALGNVGTNYSSTGSDYGSVDDATTQDPSFASSTDPNYGTGTRANYASTSQPTMSGTASSSAVDTSGTTMAGGMTRRSRTYDAVDTGTYGDSTMQNRAVNEGGSSGLTNAAEDRLNTDLDRDGDVGQRDTRNNI